MATSPTLYDILGVSTDASMEDIKKAFRKQQRVTHPDTSGNTATEHWFVLITNAFNVLSDAEQRRIYDSSLMNAAPSNETWAGEEDFDDWSETFSPSREKPSSHIPTNLANENFTPGGVDYRSMKWVALVGALTTVFMIIAFITLDMTTAVLITYGAVISISALYAFTRMGKFFFLLLCTALATVGSILSTAFMTSSVDGGQKALSLIGLTLLMASIGSILYLSVRIRTGRWNLNPKNTELVNIEAAKYPIFGVPGGELDDALDKFSEDRVNKGIIGERKTALALERLLDIPGVRIFHGLRYPVGNGRADVDHLVLCGDKMAFIDSKFWSSATYAWDGYGTILENGHHTKKGVTHFPKAVQAYAEIFRQNRVRGWILIHPNDNGSVYFDNNLSGVTRLGDESQVIEEIVQWFLDGHDGTVNRRTLHQILSWMK